MTRSLLSIEDYVDSLIDATFQVIQRKFENNRGNCIGIRFADIYLNVKGKKNFQAILFRILMKQIKAITIDEKKMKYLICKESLNLDRGRVRDRLLKSINKFFDGNSSNCKHKTYIFNQVKKLS